MKSKSRRIRKIVDRVKTRINESSRKTMDVAFIGCGSHAAANLYPALPHASINPVAVCAAHLAHAERRALLSGAESAYDDYREMLGTEKIQGLIVCADARLHYEAAREALQRGIPVFVEKPPAETPDQAAELQELCTQNKVSMMVGFNKRFCPAYREAKAIAGQSDLQSINIRGYLGDVGGEALLLSEIGIHYIDLLRYFGGEVADLQTRRKAAGGKTTLVITCKTSCGALGVVQLSSAYSWSKPGERVELLGEESLLIVEDGQKILHHKPSIAAPGKIPADGEKTTVWSPNYSVPAKENHLIFQNGYVGELRHFSEKALSRAACSPDIGDGCRALQILKDIPQTA